MKPLVRPSTVIRLYGVVARRSVGSSSCVGRVVQYTTGSSGSRSFQTYSEDGKKRLIEEKRPGSIAFADCETNAISDLFYQFARKDTGEGGVDVGGSYLSLRGVRELLHSIGERPDERTLRKLFSAADTSNDGKLHLEVSDGIM